MNFSETWKSTWPVGAVFPAPNLLSGASAKPLGPLLFGPSPSSPPLVLFSSPSLALPLPPPLHPSFLRAFFRDLREEFLPSSVQADIVASVLPDHGAPAAEDHLTFTNHLHVLRCRDGSTFVLFFPTGSNADEVGYLCLSVEGAEPEVAVEDDGDVFRQREGFAHPRHRITSMAVTEADPPDFDWTASDGPVAEGHLLVTTLYSVSWFRVEIGVPGLRSGRRRPCLVPIGKRTFQTRVVHACWNPHFQEESVVLLENGDLYWIKLNSKCGVWVRAPEGGSSRWLSCQFGGQPWILFVASSDDVVVVDLRSKNGSKRTVLAKIEEPSSYAIVHSMKNDRFIAFCKADFDVFHLSVATEHHLFLFDTRQPLVPILKWDHGLNRPCYIAMYRLWELRPSTEFKWASELGFAILVGSFWNSEFSLFCCGPKAKGDSLNLALYAWELPSALCLSGCQYNTADELLREEFSKEELPGGTEWQQQKNGIVGFFILPKVSFPILSNSEDTGGFILLRLMSSGKLEWQQYCASWELLPREPSCKLETSSEAQLTPLFVWDQEDGLVKRHDFLKFNFLSAHLSGNLSNTLTSEMHSSKLNHVESKQFYNNCELLELIDKELYKSSPSVSDCLSDASIPMSIYEIALQRALFSLPSNLLHLAFSKYSELFTGSKASSFEFLEVCGPLPHRQLPSVFIRKPSGRSEKWSHKALPADCLVGPVLPLPVLLSLQCTEQKDHTICPDERSSDDLLSHQCRMVLERVFPEVSIAEDNTLSEHLQLQEIQDEKPFLIHEPRTCASGSSIYHKTCSTVVQQKCHKSYHVESSETTFKDDKFSIFVSGIRDKPDCKSSTQDIEISQMFDDLTPMRLDIDSSGFKFSQNEHKMFSCLKRQFSKWQTEGFDEKHFV